MTAYYYTIFWRGKPCGAEFATNTHEALENYATGSIHPIEELKAVRGVKS